MAHGRWNRHGRRIGFTVSLFISDLAFEAGALQDAAKIGVSGASTLAAVLGAIALIRACRIVGGAPRG